MQTYEKSYGQFDNLYSTLGSHLFSKLGKILGIIPNEDVKFMLGQDEIKQRKQK